MLIPNDHTQHNSYCRLQLVVETFGNLLNKPTNQNSIKFHKVVKELIRKLYYKTLKTSVLNSPMSPPFLSISCVLTNRKNKCRKTWFVKNIILFSKRNYYLICVRLYMSCLSDQVTLPKQVNQMTFLYPFTQESKGIRKWPLESVHPQWWYTLLIYL